MLVLRLPPGLCVVADVSEHTAEPLEHAVPDDWYDRGDLECPSCEAAWPEGRLACPFCGVTISEVAEKVARW